MGNIQYTICSVCAIPLNLQIVLFPFCQQLPETQLPEIDQIVSMEEFDLMEESLGSKDKRAEKVIFSLLL